MTWFWKAGWKLAGAQPVLPSPWDLGGRLSPHLSRGPSWASPLSNLFTGRGQNNAHLALSLNLDDGFRVDKCKTGFSFPGDGPSGCPSFTEVTLLYIPVISRIGSRPGPPVWRPLCADTPSWDLEGKRVRELAGQKGQGTGQGGSQPGRHIYFVFRHIEHTITVTIVINLIFESLFMGHLG